MDCEAILLIEDSDFLRLQLASILEKSGHQVFLAGDVASAIEHMTKPDRIGLIVTDYRLPSVDGYSWIKFLKKTFYPNIKIAVISSYPVDSIGLPFLRKPFSIEAFLQFVQTTLATESSGSKPVFRNAVL